MEVEEFVGRERRTLVYLAKLRGELPLLTIDAGSPQQFGNHPAGVVQDPYLAAGAAEPIRAGPIVGAHPKGDLVGFESHDPAARALGLDACHRGFFGAP